MVRKILYLIGQLGSGGSERQLWYLLQRLDRTLYDLAVAVWNFAERDVYVSRIRDLNVRVHDVGENASAIGKLWAFQGLVRRFRPSIVHSYSFYTNFAAYWMLGTSSLPIGSIRGDFCANAATRVYCSAV